MKWFRRKTQPAVAKQRRETPRTTDPPTPPEYFIDGDELTTMPLAEAERIILSEWQEHGHDQDTYFLQHLRSIIAERKRRKLSPAEAATLEPEDVEAREMATCQLKDALRDERQILREVNRRFLEYRIKLGDSPAAQKELEKRKREIRSSYKRYIYCHLERMRHIQMGVQPQDLIPEATSPAVNRNMLIVGTSGYGKSTFALGVLADEADRNDTAIVCIDPHGTLANDLLTHLVHRGHHDRILYDRLSELDRVPAWEFLAPSQQQNSLKRRAENDVRIRQFADVLTRRRDMGSLSQAPATEEWLLAALRLYLYQHERVPLTVLPYAFQPGHRIFDHLIANCTHADTKYKFEEFAESRSRSQFDAARRLVDGVFQAPAFEARCQVFPGFDLAGFLNNKGILIIDGAASDGMLSDDARRTMMGSIVVRVIQFIRTRKNPYPLVTLAMDEVNNARLIGESRFETDAMAECRKMGLGFHLMVQQFDFPNATITKQVKNNCATRLYFHCADPSVANEAAADLVGGSIETKTVIEDHEIHKISDELRYHLPTTPNKGRPSERIFRIPYIRTVTTTEEFHDRTEIQNRLRQLPVGTCFVRSRERTALHGVPRLDTPPGAKEKARQALQDIQQRSEFITPSDAEPIPHHRQRSTPPPETASPDEDVVDVEWEVINPDYPKLPPPPPPDSPERHDDDDPLGI